MELAEKDARVVHLLADSGTGYDEMFRRNFPSQMYNFGIAEENMVSAAAGAIAAPILFWSVMPISTILPIVNALIFGRSVPCPTIAAPAPVTVH